jgi:hypothetical protein
VPIFISLVIYFSSERQAKTFKNQFQFRFKKKEQRRREERKQRKNEGTAVLSC